MHKNITNNHKGDLVVVDNSPSNLRLLFSLLTNHGYKVRKAINGELALNACQASPPDAILLDIMMPDMDGYEVCKKLKTNPITSDIPVIFLSALDDLYYKIQAFEIGGADYITKPFYVQEMLLRLENQLTLRKLQKQLEAQNLILQKQIQDRQKAREALQESESELRALFAAMNELIFVFDRQGCCLKIAPTNLELLNKPIQEIWGKTLPEIFPQPQADMFLGYIIQTLATQKRIDFEYSLNLKNRETWFMGTMSPISQNAVVWVMRDITRSKSVEIALRLSEEKFAKAFKSSPNIISINHLYNGKCIIDVNDTFINTFGYDREEIIGYSYNDLNIIIHPESFPEIYNNIQELNTISNQEIDLRTRSGEIKTMLISAELININGEDCILIVGNDITQRKQTEKRLQLLERAISCSVNGIVITDPNQFDNPVIYANLGFERLTGYSIAEIIGKNCRFLQGKHQNQAGFIELKKAIKQQKTCCITLLNYRKDGTAFWNELSISPVRDDNGKLTHFIGVQTDITKNKKIEQELEETKNYLELVLQASQDGFWDWNLLTNEIYFSRRWKEMIGYTDAELPNELASWEKVIFAQDKNAALQLVNDYNNGKINTFLCTQRFHHKNGSTVYILSRAIHLKNSQGQAIRMIGAHTDITELIQAQQALQHSQSLLAGVLNSSLDGIMAFKSIRDSQGNIQDFELLLINQAAEKIIESTGENIIGKYLLAEIPVHWNQELFDIYVNVVETNSPQEKEFYYEYKNIKIWIQTAIVKLEDGFAVTFRNITDRKQAEQDLQKQENAIRALYQIAAVSKLELIERLRLLLNMGKQQFGLEIGIIGKICENGYKVIAADLPLDCTLQLNHGDIFDIEPIFGNQVNMPEDAMDLIVYKSCNSDKNIFYLRLLSYFSTTIKIDDKNYAFLGFFSIKHHHHFKTSERELLNLMSQWIGNEIERAQAKTALESQMQRALLLKHLTEEIRQSLNSQQIFQTAAIQIGKTFGANRCLIHTYINNNNPQIPIVAEYIQSNYPSLQEIDIPILGNPHAELMISQDKAIVSPNVYTEPLLEAAQFLCYQIHLKSMLVIRTSYQRKPNGAIALHQCDRFREWTENEIELLEAIAAQLGIAIAHSHILEKEKQQRQELDQQNLQLQAEITVRQQAEKSLRESQRFIQGITEANPNFIYLYDLVENRNIYTNRDIHQILGYTTDTTIKLSNQIIENLLHPEDFDLFSERIKKINNIQTGEIVETEYRLRHYSGEWRWFFSRDTIFTRDENGKVKQILGTMTDISDRKRTEAALQEAAFAADAANRAKSAFLASMSHELRTPLNAIIGFTQLLARDSSLNVEQHEYINIINRSGEHLLSLINDILSMSKIEAGKITLNETSFNLYSLLNTIEQMLQIKAESKGLQLIFEIDSYLPLYVTTDESKLRQVLINLLGNAIKFTQAGKITLKVKTNRTESVKLNSDQLQNLADTELIFAIEDTGPGIEPAEIPILFDPFVQTTTGKKSQEGTGLGLPISKQFVQLMGGEINVNSTLGIGTTFSFNIKISLASATEIQSQTNHPRVIALAPNQATYRILIVDDLKDNRHLLIMLLKPLGFELREAENGQEALHLWSTWQPHLIWMDMRMPIMDGYEATKRIKANEQGKTTVIIALTASALEEDRTSILSTGCDDFVRKPFPEEIIFEKMSQHLGLRYIYEEQSQPSLPQTDHHNISYYNVLENQDLTTQLQKIPKECLEEIYQAALCADDELILSLLTEIPNAASPFAEIFRNLVNDFRFDKIIDLIENNRI